jgi:nucleotide-binding universal stress UspA family protein/RimJ/RimL family protein N-acetyltransferase
MTRVKLRDGSQITIRPIDPADREELAEGFRRLSPESRYRRFFAPVPELRARDLDYLTGVDHHDHEALVAIDADTGAGVGVARFVRTGAGQAEPAMVVADDWQGRGVATALLDALVVRAQEEGIGRFVAPVLAGNVEAMRVLERLGTATQTPSGREVQLDIALTPQTGALSRLSRLLQEFAVGSVTPARTLLDLLVPRRRGTLEQPRGNRIVVGVDGSPGSELAARMAQEVASVLNAGVHVVGVHRVLLGDTEELRSAVRETAAALRGQGLQVYEHIRRGEPGLVLPDVADEEGARLIVVGAGRLPEGVRRVLGTTAEAVAQRAPCDVLIARPPVSAEMPKIAPDG